MQEFRKHLEQEFLAALPIWIDKDSVVLNAIKDAVVSILIATLKTYKEESDFINEDEAKAAKQEDVTIKLPKSYAPGSFKDKFRLIFRRGSVGQTREIEAVVDSVSGTRLLKTTALNTDTLLSSSDHIRITPSTGIVSGWIADVTYPGIEKETSQQDGNDYIFSEENWLLVEVVNESDM